MVTHTQAGHLHTALAVPIKVIVGPQTAAERPDIPDDTCVAFKVPHDRTRGAGSNGVGNQSVLMPVGFVISMHINTGAGQLANAATASAWGARSPARSSTSADDDGFTGL